MAESKGVKRSALFNSENIEKFLKSDKKYVDLPKLEIELFLSEHNEETDGKINSDKTDANGLKLTCKPNALLI